MKARLIGFLLFVIYSLLKATWRIQIIEPESFQVALKDGRPMVFAHWHGDELGLVHLLGRYKSAAMISTSKDGQIMDTVARLFGSQTSRGSSTRGGVSAVRGIIRLARDGWRPSIAVDGPKGPIYQVKPGVFEISKLIGGEIFTLTAACDRKFVFKKSWNKSFLPLPFARLVILWGEGLPAVSRNADPHDPDLARALESKLSAAGLQANLIATT